MTATIYSKSKGMFSVIDTEETCYQVEKACDGKGIRKIINAMKEPYKIECRFDCGNGEVFFVERKWDDVENGTYTVNHIDEYRNTDDAKKMDAKSIIKILENRGKMAG